MIDKEELQDFIKQVIKAEVTIYVESVPKSDWSRGKIQVSLSMDNEEFAFYETYVE